VLFRRQQEKQFGWSESGTGWQEPGKFLDLSGTGHSVPMAGAGLATYKCPGVQGMFTPNTRQLMRCSGLNSCVLGLQIWI